MVNTFVLFCLCLCRLLDVTDAVKSVSVMEGDSVTLNTDVTEVQKYLLIQWTFGSSRIAEFNRLMQTSSLYDERFRDRLKLDQTGSLTITNTRTTDSGLYQLSMVGEETKYKRFNVTVNDAVKSVSVMEGDSVTLNTDVTEVQKYLLIQWTFGSSRISEFNRLMQTSSVYDERFRDRLKMDSETGSLTITNTRTTDSGLYQISMVGEETKYKRFNVTVNESPWSTSSPSSSIFMTSNFVVKNSTVNQTENNNTEVHQPSSDHIHCCGFTEAVIRLVVSAVVGMATVAVLVYDIRSTRRELIWTRETNYLQTLSVKSDHQYEFMSPTNVDI